MPTPRVAQRAPRAGSNNIPQQPRASGADQAGDAEDLAAMQHQRLRSGHERIDLQDGLAGLARAARIQIVDRPAHHQPHDLLGRGLGGHTRAGDASVPQHDDAIGHALHLFDEVRDVDDGVPLLP